MNNGVIILSYCEIDELHLLFLPLKPWLTRCSSAPCTADLSIPHAAGRRIQRALEPGHYRAHSACSNAEARSSSKWYGEFLVADQSCEKLPFFFFWFCFFFFLLQSVGDTEAFSKELLGQTQKLSSPALHNTSGDSGDHSTGQELRHVSLPFCTLSTCSSQVQYFGHNLQVSA